MVPTIRNGFPSRFNLWPDRLTNEVGRGRVPVPFIVTDATIEGAQAAAARGGAVGVGEEEDTFFDALGDVGFRNVDVVFARR